MNLKIPLVLAPQPDGGYSVTSPVLPGGVVIDDPSSPATFEALVTTP